MVPILCSAIDRVVSYVPSLCLHFLIIAESKFRYCISHDKNKDKTHTALLFRIAYIKNQEELNAVHNGNAESSKRQLKFK